MHSIVDRKVGMRRMTVIGNMALANLGFYTRNNLSENNPQFGHAPLQLFASQVLGRKRISVQRGAEYLICPRRPHLSGGGGKLVVLRRLVFVYGRFGTAKVELLDT